MAHDYTKDMIEQAKNPIYNCIACNKVFKRPNSKFCSAICREATSRQKVIEKRKAEGGIGCLVCGEYHKQLAFHLRSAHNMSTAQYKEQFPGALTICQNSVQKYRENWAGDKNPAVGSDGKLSPFSRKFTKYEGMTEEQKDFAISEAVNKYIKSTPKENRPMNIEYWVKQGMSEAEAKIKVSERQTTFSLEKCIEKYGEEQGRKKWAARQEKWQDTLNAKPIEELARINRAKMDGSSGSISKVSRKLFSALHVQGARWGSTVDGHGGEAMIKAENKSFMLDFVLANKCIEFNGDFWHANPKVYAADKVIGRIGHTKNSTAADVWEKDVIKHQAIANAGYELLVIWEGDYLADPEGTILKCKEFLAV